MELIGLIAGNGGFPLTFAREARRRGFRVAAVAHHDETDPALEAEVDSVTWVRVGQLGKLIGALKAGGVERTVMAGGINKARSLLSLRPDARGAKALARAAVLGDDNILRAVADEIEQEGISVIPSTIFLESLLAPAGPIAGPAPSPEALEDVNRGFELLTVLGPHDVGQGVMLESGAVLAIEAVEGTDAMICRGAAFAKGQAVVVKAAKAGQDMRFDVPAVGPQTLAAMSESGAGTLAIETGSSIILDRAAFDQQAAGLGIAVIGVTND